MLERLIRSRAVDYNAIKEIYATLRELPFYRLNVYPRRLFRDKQSFPSNQAPRVTLPQINFEYSRRQIQSILQRIRRTEFENVEIFLHRLTQFLYSRACNTCACLKTNHDCLDREIASRFPFSAILPASKRKAFPKSNPPHSTIVA